ncbi:MAG: AAA family ATPase [Myxococcota bacterium]
MIQPAHTLAHRIADERARLFVGRDAELARLDAMLEPDSPRRVAFVHGPGGTGKTELLTAFTRGARARGVRVGWLDGGQVAVSETALAGAVTTALAEAEASSEVALGQLLVAAVVLLIDRFELLAPLETWFRERFLPTLDAGLRVVVASRSPLASGWSASAAWSSLIEPIALGGLPPAAAAEYLARRGVAAERRADIVRVTGGHPLALGLFAEVALRDPKVRLELGAQPEVVQALLENLLQGVPDDLHRQALWSAALVRYTTEELIAAMVDAARAPALFEWLRHLSFMRVGPAGLAPHDLIRDLLSADLAWRYPHLRRRLLARAAAHFRAAMQRHPRLRVALVMEVAFLWRVEVPLAGFDTGGLYTSEPRAGDWPELEAMLQALHGPESVPLLRYWVERGGQLVVVRGEGERPQALALYLWLERIAADDVARDPAVASLRRYLEARGELVGAVCWRFLVDKDTLELPAASTAVLTAFEFEHFVCRPEVSDGYGIWLAPEHGLQTLPPGMLARCPEADFDLDGRRYGVIRTTACGKNQLEWCMDGLFAPLAEDDGVDAPIARPSRPACRPLRRLPIGPSGWPPRARALARGRARPPGDAAGAAEAAEAPPRRLRRCATATTSTTPSPRAHLLRRAAKRRVGHRAEPAVQLLPATPWPWPSRASPIGSGCARS